MAKIVRFDEAISAIADASYDIDYCLDELGNALFDSPCGITEATFDAFISLARIIGPDICEHYKNVSRRVNGKYYHVRNCEDIKPTRRSRSKKSGK